MATNNLLFMFTIELLLVSLGVSIFLYVKYIKIKRSELKGNKSSVSNEFKDSLKNEFDIITTQIEELQKKSGDDDDKKFSISSLSAKRHFLSAVIKNLASNETENGDIIWQSIIKQQNEITTKLFDSIKTANKDRKLLKSITGQCNILKVQLEEYKNKVVETTEKMSRMSKANEELTTTIEMLIPEAEMSEELKEALSKAQNNKNELDKFLSTLEEENLKLSAEAGKDKGEINQLSDLADNMADEYSSLMKQKKDLEQKYMSHKEEMDQKCKDLEKEIEEKNKALSAVQNNFKTLEEEYERLYEETKGEEEG